MCMQPTIHFRNLFTFRISTIPSIRYILIALARCGEVHPYTGTLKLADIPLCCISDSSAMIVFFGSPLMDIIAKVDHDFLKKYNLKQDDAVRATPELEGVFRDVLSFNPILLPGGSVTNTARVFQWVSKRSYPVTFIGPMGDDNFGRIIKDKFVEEEIHKHLTEIEGRQTGICAVLLTDDKRSLVTHLGPSQLFSVNNLDEKSWKDINQAKYLYLSAFRIRANFAVMEKLTEHCLENKKFIIINLAASSLPQRYPKEVTYLLGNADMVFGNEAELVSFAEVSKIETANIQDMLEGINELFRNKPSRLLIMTRGSKSVIVKTENTLEEFEVSHLEEKQIVDTTGAGDAFVGGFLARFVKNEPISDCVRCGTWAAKEIIRNHGCNFDNKLVYDYMPVLFNFSLSVKV